MIKTAWRYRIIRALPVGLVAGLCSLAPATGSASTWTLTQVDNSADVGKFTSLAIDTGKNLHVSYFDSTGALKYATNKGGSWVPKSITSSGVVAGGTSIALDPSGYPQVNFYYNASTSNRGIRNISYNGSTWTTNGINGSYLPLTDWNTSIVNKAGFTYVIFVKNAGGGNITLNYSRNQTSGNYAIWSTPTTIDSTNGSGANNSEVVDSTGAVHVVGYNATSGAFSYYTNSSGSWVATPLTTANETIGKWCSLAVDAYNNLHLTYLATTTSPASYRIKYRFKPAGGSWQDESDVADAGANGGYPSIAADGAGNPHISYYYSTASTSGTLRYATYANNSWQTDEVDSASKGSAANVGSYSSIEVDSDQTVAIAYYDVTTSALKVATRKALLVSPGTVNFGTVDRGFQSATSNLTITNNTLGPVTIGDLSQAGSNAGDFGIDSNSCSGAQIAGQASCTVGVHFAPPAAAPRSAARSGSISVAAATPYPGVSATLSGTTSANFLLTASASNGGTISPSVAAVPPNGSQSFTVTASNGFMIGDVTVDGSTLLPSPYLLTNVNADHSVQANLVAPFRVFESSTFFSTLQSAFESVNPGWTIQALTTIPAGDLLIDRDVEVTLSGGYNSTFTSQTGTTGMTGNILISNGTLNVESIVMQ